MGHVGNDKAGLKGVRPRREGHQEGPGGEIIGRWEVKFVSLEKS